MRFSLATNFDDALIDRVRGTPVDELFGKLPSDAAGGGRASYQIPGLSWRGLERHVRLARDAGIRFNYLLNAACLDNQEVTRPGQKRLRALLDRVVQAGAAAVTVASPFLLKIVKRCHPSLRVRVSVFAGVDHVRKARQWEDLGADTLMLDSLLVNREFRLLRAIRQSVRCELELLANNSCLASCAWAPTHMNALAHASQSGHPTKGFFIDWCFLHCTREKLLDPVNYVRSEWIRPEDLHHYEALGYSAFKLAERGAPTEILARRVRAYAERRYDGNLLDLVQPYGFARELTEPAERRSFWWRLRHLFRPFLVDLRRLWGLKQLAEERGMLRGHEGPAPVTIDNRALDGFLDRFRTHGCKDIDCDDCRWCHRFAEQAVRVDPAWRDRCLERYERVFDDLHSGRMWGLRSAPFPV